jgi:hypothetical protein
VVVRAGDRGRSKRNRQPLFSVSPLLERMRPLLSCHQRQQKKRSHPTPTLSWARADYACSRQHSSSYNHQRPSIVYSLRHAEPDIRSNLVCYSWAVDIVNGFVCHLLALVARSQGL